MGEMEKALAAISKKAEVALDEVADFIFSRSQEEIVSKGAIDEGTLLKSGNVIRLPGLRIIVYSAPYASAVEFGTDPHMPPVGPLIGWAKRKLGLSSVEARKVAWAIARTIEKEGSDPVAFLQTGINEARLKFKGVRIGFD